MIPLLPGFEGDVGAPGGSSLQAVLHWTYQSLSQGPNSLLQRLKAVMPDPFKYIHVGSLRTYDQLGQKLVREWNFFKSFRGSEIFHFLFEFSSQNLKNQKIKKKCLKISENFFSKYFFCVFSCFYLTFSLGIPLKFCKKIFLTVKLRNPLFLFFFTYFYHFSLSQSLFKIHICIANSKQIRS